MSGLKRGSKKISFRSTNIKKQNKKFKIIGIDLSGQLPKILLSLSFTYLPTC